MIPTKPRTFDNFPEEKLCPVCGTNENAECVLLGIDGTLEGQVEEAAPVHLWCAVADRLNDKVGVIYKGLRKK